MKVEPNAQSVNPSRTQSGMNSGNEKTARSHGLSPPLTKQEAHGFFESV